LVSLLGTEYSREYPAAGELDAGQPPTITDLAGGYRTLGTFLATWEHATPEQRADLWLYDQEVKHDAWGQSTGFRLWKGRKRDKWPVRYCEEQPRTVHAARIDGQWFRLDKRDLARALKGTKSAVRIGSVTIKPSILKELIAVAPGQQIELGDLDSALGFRTVDPVKRDGMDTIAHRTQCAINHGAGDLYAGRNGWETRIVFS